MHTFRIEMLSFIYMYFIRWQLTAPTAAGNLVEGRMRKLPFVATYCFLLLGCLLFLSPLPNNLLKLRTSEPLLLRRPNLLRRKTWFSIRARTPLERKSRFTLRENRATY